MALDKHLKELGWCLTSEGYTIVTENGSLKDINAVVQKALSCDLKDIGSSVLNTELKKDQTDKLVLQIQKIHNISAPKANQESQAAPRMFRIILNDGHMSCQAIELSEIPKLLLKKTPPGTKVQIEGAKIISGCILLKRDNCTVLGGIVPSLYEKWEMTRNVETERRSSNVDGPPPWVNFGEKIISSETIGEFKSLASKTTREASKEFEEQRQGAITEAKMGAVKKTFGGGIKASNLNKNEQPSFNRDNRRDKIRDNENKGSFRKEKESKEKVDKLQSKPVEKISLFDFLENKLPSTGKESEDCNVNNTTSKPAVNSSSQSETGSKFKPSYNTKPPRLYQQRQDNFDTKSKQYPDNKYQRGNSKSEQTSQNSPVISHIKEQSFHTNKDVSNTVQNELANKVEKMSVSGEYASRMLKQHLNLVTSESPGRKPQNSPRQRNWNWKIGDQCMAKYWEDNKYYSATITDLTSRTCVVQFNGYGNIEEVLKTDCVPPNNGQRETYLYGNQSTSQGYSEFNRNSHSQHFYGRKT